MAGGQRNKKSGGGAWPLGKFRCWLIILVLTSYCGYHFVTGQAQLADGEDSLWISPVRNNTVEFQAASLLWENLHRQVLDRGLKVKSESRNVLESSLKKVETLVDAATMVSGRFSSRLYRLVVGADFRLLRSGLVVWEKHLEESETYLVAPDLRGTDANRQAALKVALERMAREVIEQIANF